ncbi:MAG TPA: hypothetical protein VFB89_06440, partial [Gemmatimonadales bacterium]|nr:hypothetical protein [Gemmatimonadales bacterium]
MGDPFEAAYDLNLQEVAWASLLQRISQAIRMIEPITADGREHIADDDAGAVSTAPACDLEDEEANSGGLAA